MLPMPCVSICVHIEFILKHDNTRTPFWANKSCWLHVKVHSLVMCIHVQDIGMCMHKVSYQIYSDFSYNLLLLSSYVRTSGFV